ncbi:MAG TPA: chorismate mutase [Candidatus Lustribacter sp.]|nr:chorismate mutase [Candidatus Lustribacter sp.]
MSAVRGVRGAITVERDDATLLLDATERLLRAIVAENDIRSDDVASALFTLTPDLVSQFPAAAARRMGWTLVPLLNFTEIAVPDGLPRVIRVLLHVNTDKRQDQIVHVYLDGARVLRPDLDRS